MSIQATKDRIEDGSKRARQTIFKALSRLLELWDLQDNELATLLHIDSSTFSKWKKAGQIPAAAPDEQIQTVLAIHRSVGSMFQNPADQRLWLKTKHPAFGDIAPIDVASASLDGLFRVRRYVDYVRGRGA